MPTSSQQSAGVDSGPILEIPAGRFAPSPTGDLHFGSLLAAMASLCDARKKNGRWLLRIDDIDGPRSVPGSAEAIQRSLEQYGFEWDGPVQWQSQHLERYEDALAELVKLQLVFACNCSRRSLPAGKVYPGNCRHQKLSLKPAQAHYQVDDHALRCHLTGSMSFVDSIQGEQVVDIEHSVGDVIIWRRDKLVGYSLACALDDASTTTDVVRGADLLTSTSAQIAIMDALGMRPPRYAHIPVAIDGNGDKLSKHSKAQSISTLQTLPTLLQAWSFLGQRKFPADTVEGFWSQAFETWQLSLVPRKSRVAI